jgi:hypothetical protein
LLFTLPAVAQQSPQPNTVGRIALADARDVKFSGAVSVNEGDMAVGNGSTVTAANKTTHIKLALGGTVNVCATTSVQLTKSGESIMLSLDRGAVETHRTMSNASASDVVQTPDLRIMISAPGSSDVRVRVNGRGDTCVENHGGSDAPYVSVSPQIGDGLYRVEGGQRVMFEHGDLHEVVDHEPYPCGCPPDEQPKPEEFPLAVSQGLTPVPPPATKPVASPGEVHAQVTASLVFDSQGAAAPRDSDSATEGVAKPAPAAPAPPQTAEHLAPVPVQQGKPKDVVHIVGRFFSRLFGKPRSVTY